MALVTVYDLAHNAALVGAMQRTSLAAGSGGLSVEPALVGSSEWWQAVEAGTLPRLSLEGVIRKTFMGGMGDLPEFELQTPDGVRSTWLREGADALYQRGSAVRVTYVHHPWKTPQRAFDPEGYKVVLRIEIDDSGPPPPPPSWWSRWFG